MRAEKFAHNAQGCLLKGKRANSPVEKMALLALAQSWLELADAASVMGPEGAGRGMRRFFGDCKDHALTGHS